MTKNQPELKACFYCTGTAERYGAKLHHGIQCINCGVQVSMTGSCAREEIVYLWNSIPRPSPIIPEAAVTREYKIDDNGDYEWVVDPETGEGMSLQKICDLLNSKAVQTITDDTLRDAVERVQDSVQIDNAYTVDAGYVDLIITHALKSQEKPDTSFSLIKEWFEKCRDARSGDAKALWSDGLQHLLYYKAQADKAQEKPVPYRDPEQPDWFNDLSESNQAEAIKILKQEKPVEVTVKEFNDLIDPQMPSFNNIGNLLLNRFPNGIKIIDGGA